MRWTHSPLRDALPPIAPGHVPESMRPHIEAIRRRGHMRRITGLVIGAVYYSALLALAASIAWLYAEATDRAVPTLTTVTITTPVVAPGTDLAMDVHPHLLRRCEGKVLFLAYDGAGNIINQSETEWRFPAAQLGPDRTFNRKLRISRDAVESLPDRAHSGALLQDARLRIERKFFCNPVQKLLGWPIVEVMPDMPFTIAGDRR